MIQIFKAFVLFLKGVGQILHYVFIKQPVIGVGIAVLSLGWWLGNKHGVKETLRKTDKQLFEIKRESRNLFVRDSISIAKLGKENDMLYVLSDSLRTSLESANGQIGRYQIAIKGYVSTIKSLEGDLASEKGKIKVAIDSGKIVFLKPVDIFKKGVYKKIPAGEIKEIRD